MNSYNIKYFTLAFFISIPIILWAILQILPTFDDWTTLSAPNRDPNFIQYFLPYGMTWRPGDALFGYINGISYKLFPKLNHILVFAAHIGSTLLVYKITKILCFRINASIIATLFFYISPCVLGNILSCDATNQSFAHFWGILAVYLYLNEQNKRKYLLWVTCVYLASAFKDNGIAWSIIPPIISYAFDKIEKQRFKTEFMLGLAIAVIYAIVRLTIPHHLYINASYADDVVSLYSRIKGFITWIGYTWFSVDYICIIHKPSRNFYMAVGTFLLSFPFMLAIWKNKYIWKNKTIWLLITAFTLVVSPNLLISMTIMNAYGSLGIAAIIVAYLVEYNKHTKNTINILLTMYILSVAIVDGHHWYNAWQTSLPEKTISQTIIKKTGRPVNKAFCILIKDDYPKYSSFCVPKDETIGWGRSIWHETGYKWPQQVNDTTIDRNKKAHEMALQIAKNKLKLDYEAIWIVDKEQVRVIKKQDLNK